MGAALEGAVIERELLRDPDKSCADRFHSFLRTIKGSLCIADGL